MERLYIRFSLASIQMIAKITRLKTIKDLNKLDDATLNDLEYLYKAELYPLRIILIVFGIGILTVNTIGLLFKIGRLEWLLIIFTLFFSIFVANKIKNKFIEIVKNEKNLRKNKRAMNLFIQKKSLKREEKRNKTASMRCVTSSLF